MKQIVFTYEIHSVGVPTHLTFPWGNGNKLTSTIKQITISETPFIGEIINSRTTFIGKETDLHSYLLLKRITQYRHYMTGGAGHDKQMPDKVIISHAMIIGKK